VRKEKVMQKESFQIGTACFIGAGIGTLLSLEVFGGFWIILGFLIGGFVGYISLNPLQILKTFAWNLKRFGVAIIPSKETLKFYSLAWMGILISFSILMFSICFLFVEFVWAIILNHTDRTASFFEIYLVVALTTSICFTLIDGGKILWGFDRANKMRNVKELLIDVLKYGNLVVWVYWVFYGLFHTPYKAILFKSLDIFSRFLKALWATFVVIHSSKRLLCGVDSFLGAIVGFCYSHALIGAIAGLFLGVVNYEIISIRILKIAPKKAE
jgi:hypothetical protein